MIFAYPPARETRLHGPDGYDSYESYRPWLRDEFLFRCVYCLKRETWGHATGEYDLDHFNPRSVMPEHRVDYLNLVYSCRRCNIVKRDQRIDDPVVVLTGETVTVLPDGTLASGDPQSWRLIRQLDLNSPAARKWRVMWMRLTALARERDPDLYRLLVGYPESLPDLGRLRPPVNRKPEGVHFSCLARRQRGELPAEY